MISNVGGNWLMNHQCMPDVGKNARNGQIFYAVRAYYASIYFGANKHTRTHVEESCDKFIQISEYS